MYVKEMGEDTPTNRKDYCDAALALIQPVLSLPEEQKDIIVEFFEPNEVAFDTIKQHLLPLFNKMMDYEGTDLGFVEMLKKESGLLACKLIGELNEGFNEATEEVFNYF